MVAWERFNASAYRADSPSLKPRRAELFARAYAEARRLASAEAGLAVEAFPTEPPLAWEQASGEDCQPWTALADPAA